MLTEIPIDADLCELVPAFVNARMKDLADLNRHLQSKDYVAIQKISHTIKGIARPYGFPTLEGHFKKLEILAKAQEFDQCADCIDQIQEYFKSYSQV